MKKVHPEQAPENGNFIMDVMEDSDSDSEVLPIDSASVSSQELFLVDADLESSADQHRSMDLVGQASLQDTDSMVSFLYSLYVASPYTDAV